MSKRLMRAIIALTAVSLVIGVAMAGAQSSSTEFDATMKGSSETPTKGPAKAKGTFKVEFRSGNRACYTMSVSGLGAVPIAAHIHRGKAGVAGPIVIDLKPSFKGTSPRVSKKCVTGTAAVIRAIKRNPSAGAARGQLRVHT